MAIGLLYGYDTPSPEKREILYGKVNPFLDRFTARHGSIICRELLGYDLNDPGDREIISEKKLFATLCMKFVRDSADMLEELIGEKREA